MTSSESIRASNATDHIGEEGSNIPKEYVTNVILRITRVVNNWEWDIVEVESSCQNTHQGRKRRRDETDVRQVTVISRLKNLIIQVGLIYRLIMRVFCIGEWVDTDADGENYDDADENDAERVDLSIDRGVLWADHGECYDEDYNAGVRVAELAPVCSMRNCPRFAPSKTDEVEDDGVQVLSKELKEKDDRNGEVDDKADHASDISFVSELLA